MNWFTKWLFHRTVKMQQAICREIYTMTTRDMRVTGAHVDEYQRQGAVLVPGLFTDWVEVLRAGIERNMKEPGPHAAENLQPGDTGRFFDDYCNWQRIPEFTDFARKSPAAGAAAQLMQSKRVQMFHDHVLVKEPSTSKPTPWHQDSPYYFVEGEQTLSFWIPLDAVNEASLRMIKGSHKWDKPVLPTRWLAGQDFYPAGDDYIAVPDPDEEPDKYTVLEWPMQPGDAVAFHYKTVHGARGNQSSLRRRAFSLRVVGDDARYVIRPGPTSPPFSGHGMREGQVLRKDWFPVLWPV